MSNPAPLASVRDVAEFLDVPVATLYNWRNRRTGPPGLRVGRHLRYRWTDVEAWLREQVDADPLTTR